jgi:hypothetical protein
MELSDTDIILFPHCYLTEGALNKALETFGNLRICLPWYMEPPGAVSEIGNGSNVKVLYPPENLKPDGGFLPLLSDYRFWMKENMGNIPHISASKLEEDEASWDIRKTIRPKEESSEKWKDRITRWHLILHLSGEMEKENADADAALGRIIASGSPLKEAMGDEHPEGIFDDLPVTPPSSIGKDTQRLNNWIEAWFGLFGSHVSPGSRLLTLNRDIFGFVVDLFGGPFSEISDGSFSELRIGETIELPEPSGDSNPKKESILTNLVGKTIHLLECP